MARQSLRQASSAGCPIRWHGDQSYQKGGLRALRSDWKDFDWAAVTRLKERLPSGATGRFLHSLAAVPKLFTCCPISSRNWASFSSTIFVSEIEPLPERPPSEPS